MSLTGIILILMLFSWGIGLCSYPILRIAYIELLNALDESEQKEKT